MDWGEGHYEDTAAELEPVAQHVIASLKLRGDESVLDIGCGTGNAALAAARSGARVTGIDPAARLLDVARQRASAEELDITFEPGDAQTLNFHNDQFDAVVAVFSSIFAPDAGAVAREMRRVTRPGGTMVLTSWSPEGAIYDMGNLLRESLPRFPKPPPWGEAEFLREQFEHDGATVSLTKHTIAFSKPSAKQWLTGMETRHPMFMQGKLAIESSGGDWPTLRREVIALLESANELEESFRITSVYWCAKSVLA